MSKIFLENNTAATIELGDMFYGGGVPIDHYIIQVEDGTVLETPGPTYSFDIMYNTSLSVNISAHNCAGYSDPFTLELQHNEGRVNDYLTMMSQIPIQWRTVVHRVRHQGLSLRVHPRLL